MSNEVLEPSGSASSSDALSLIVADVTDTQHVEVTVPSGMNAGEVARQTAARLNLPSNVPWSLRDSSSQYLADEVPIGDQVARMADREAPIPATLTPKAHLGSR